MNAPLISTAIALAVLSWSTRSVAGECDPVKVGSPYDEEALSRGYISALPIVDFQLFQDREERCGWNPARLLYVSFGSAYGPPAVAHVSGFTIFAYQRFIMALGDDAVAGAPYQEGEGLRTHYLIFERYETFKKDNGFAMEIPLFKPLN